ncbi:methyltransferase family protein [Sphingomonas sp. MMS12-HWE2-04]|uniref:methyltransferase family protein n=1 Tax=Sphingomonas sp. MMS12-HWE2-04 TaxID=3234199 RepID=UPI00384D65D3
MSWVAPQPTSLGAVVVMALGFALFVASLGLVRLRLRHPGRSKGGHGAPRSMLGVAIQSLGFLAVGVGPIVATLAPGSPAGLAQAALVLALMGLTIGLFAAAAHAMGHNWSIVARTRSDHALVTWGPFALVRHPIYVALFAMLLAMALAFGHLRGLVPGVPLYWIGTWLRVAEEERLLRLRFGPTYDAYAARVKRFVPGLL